MKSIALFLVLFIGSHAFAASEWHTYRDAVEEFEPRSRSTGDGPNFGGLALVAVIVIGIVLAISYYGKEDEKRMDAVMERAQIKEELNHKIRLARLRLTERFTILFQQKANAPPPPDVLMKFKTFLTTSSTEELSFMLREPESLVVIAEQAVSDCQPVVAPSL